MGARNRTGGEKQDRSKEPGQEQKGWTGAKEQKRNRTGDGKKQDEQERSLILAWLRPSNPQRDGLASCKLPITARSRKCSQLWHGRSQKTQCAAGTQQAPFLTSGRSQIESFRNASCVCSGRPRFPNNYSQASLEPETYMEIKPADSSASKTTTTHSKDPMKILEISCSLPDSSKSKLISSFFLMN